MTGQGRQRMRIEAADVSYRQLREKGMKCKGKIGYACFIFILALLLLLCILDLCLGHIYFGPSDSIRSNQSGQNPVSVRNAWETEFVNGSKKLWGVSLRFLLSDQDYKGNLKRTSGELYNVKKENEPPEREGTDENITVTMLKESGAGKQEKLGEWIVSVGEIRPESDFKFVLTQPVSDMQDVTVKLRVETGLEQARAVLIENVQPICARVSVTALRVALLVFCAFLLFLSVFLATRADYPRAWLILGGILALAWLIALPYARVPDEESHFFRIYEITQGHMLTEPGEEGLTPGRQMPGNLDMDVKQHYATLRDMIDHRKLQLDRTNETWYSFPNMALYSPASYLPQILGVKLADCLTENVLLIIYAGRLCGLLAGFFLFYRALKILPVKRECMFFLLMLPVVFQELISLSADSFINGLSIFLTCFCLSCIFSDADAKLAWGGVFSIWLLAPLVGLCKMVYLPLCAMFFLIPARMFPNQKKMLHTIGPVALAVGGNVLWTVVGKVGDAASKEQIAYIVGHPYAFLQTAYRTLQTFGHDVIMEFMGSNMGGLNIPVYELPLLFALGFLVVLAAAPAQNGRRIEGGLKLRLALIWLLVLALTWGSMYLGYNEAGNNLIVGFQGRYLIPIAFLMLTTLESTWFVRKKDDLRRWLYPIAVSLNLYTLFYVLQEVTW